MVFDCDAFIAAAPVWMDTTTDQSESTSEAPPTPRTPKNNTTAGKKHNFVPKTVAAFADMSCVL